MTPDPVPASASAPAPAASDPYAGWVVAGTWAVMLAVLIFSIGRLIPPIPLGVDDYCLVPLLFGEGGNPVAGLWAQHNEHRIPLPKLLYAAVFKLSGDNFRAPAIMNLVVLAAAAAGVVQAVRRLRGGYAYTDAFIPVVMMHPGHWENLIWAFQIQFLSSVVLCLLYLCLAASPRFAASPGRVAVAGAATLLLPLCGANGVALVPAFACGLLFAGGWNLWSGDPGLRRPGGGAVAAGVLGLAAVPAYFAGLEPIAAHPKPGGWVPVAVGAMNFLGMGFGMAAQAGHRPNTLDPSWLGVGMLVALAATVAALLRAARDPGRRASAAGLAAGLGGLACLALGLAYGRVGLVDLLNSSRYATLAVPLAVGVYLAWAVVVPGPVGRLVRVGLLAVGLVALGVNLLEAVPAARLVAMIPQRTAHDIRSGMPVSFVIDRNYAPPAHAIVRAAFPTLRANRVRVFADLRDDPPMTETPVPLTVIPRGAVAANGATIWATGSPAAAVIPLPRRQFVYGLKVTYEAAQEGGLFRSMISWEPGGESYPPRPGFAIVGQLYPLGHPATTLVYVNQETDAVRFDIEPPGVALRLHALSVVTAAE